jgi:excinuclease ABC subunit A
VVDAPDVKIPLRGHRGSGSGGSTLVNEILFMAVANRLHRAKQRPGAHRRVRGLEEVDKIINIDQSPIGRTPRSNPAVPGADRGAGEGEAGPATEGRSAA